MIVKVGCMQCKHITTWEYEDSDTRQELLCQMCKQSRVWFKGTCTFIDVQNNLVDNYYK